MASPVIHPHRRRRNPRVGLGPRVRLLQGSREHAVHSHGPYYAEPLQYVDGLTIWAFRAQSIFLFQSAIGSALGEAFVWLSADPLLVV